MPWTNFGRDLFTAAVIGEAITSLNNANAYLAVGNSTTAFAATQTDLIGASKTRKAMDATYPQRSTNVVTFKSTFGTSDANHAWDEWGVANASSGANLCTRKVEALGTKTSASTWVLTATLTTTVPAT